jgi:tetratricopeptide (TPR) repeat protein
MPSSCSRERLKLEAKRVLSLLLSAALLLGALLPVAAFAPGLPLAVAAEVQGRAERLEALFARLASTNDALEGDTIVEEIWRIWLASGRPEIDAIMQNALALVEAGRPQAAMPLLDSIVERAPEWAEGWNKRATVLYLIDEYERSLADIDRVLALEPRHFGALAGRGLIHIAQENYRAALDDYRRARAVNPFLQGAAQMIPTLERRVGERPL